MVLDVCSTRHVALKPCCLVRAYVTDLAARPLAKRTGLHILIMYYRVFSARGEGGHFGRLRDFFSSFPFSNAVPWTLSRRSRRQSRPSAVRLGRHCHLLCKRALLQRMPAPMGEGGVHVCIDGCGAGTATTPRCLLRLSRTLGDHMVLARSGSMLYGFDSAGSNVTARVAGRRYGAVTVRRLHQLGLSFLPHSFSLARDHSIAPCGCSVAAVWLQCGCSVAAVWLLCGCCGCCVAACVAACVRLLCLFVALSTSSIPVLPPCLPVYLFRSLLCSVLRMVPLAHPFLRALDIYCLLSLTTRDILCFSVTLCDSLPFLPLPLSSSALPCCCLQALCVSIPVFIYFSIHFVSITVPCASPLARGCTHPFSSLLGWCWAGR